LFRRPISGILLLLKTQLFLVENLENKEYIIKLPQHTNFEIRLFAEFLRTLSKIFKNIPFSMSLNMINKRIFYTVKIPTKYSSVMENQLYAVFPKIELEEIRRTFDPQNAEIAAQADLVLRYGDHYPFLTFEAMEASFLSDIFNQFNRLTAQEKFFMQLKIKPLDPDKAIFTMKRGVKLGVKNFTQRFNVVESIFSKKASPEIRSRGYAAATEKNRQPLYLTEVTIILFSESHELAAAKLEPIAQVFQKLESEYNEFRYKIKRVTPLDLERVSSLDIPPTAYHLTSEEVSSMYHFPPNSDSVPNLYKILSPKAEPPLGLPTVDNTPPDELTPFAETNYRNTREKFGIKRRDRARHMYVIGKSGSGKSKMLELMIKNDIEFGHGICVIDPHGDLIENIVPYIPESRVKDVIFFNPVDEEYPIAFNPIEKVSPMLRQQVAMGLIEIFKKVFGSNWTPRLEHVLRMTILALLDAPKASVMSILLLLTDREYRQNTIKSIEDQVVKNFWTNEFAGWSEKFDSEAIMPILNKIGQFVSSTIIRNIVGQEDNKIDMPQIMDSRKILLVKLPKGILQEENSSLLGSMIITKIYQAALGRADIPENQRVPFFLYVDEFQNFATDTFANILSEARKYKLSLTMAHQYVSQLNDVVKKTVFGNVGSIISFRIGPEDAMLMEQEFEPKFTAQDIVNLGVREIYLKLSIDDEVKEAFSARTLTVPAPTFNFREQIVQFTRENYCRNKASAEKTLKQEKSKEMEVLEKLKEENFSAPIL
jgi:hypothetical protein